MAARVNIRFLLALIIVLGAVLGAGGAYFLLQEQTAEDHTAKAEELIAGGALKPALQQLEAAIGKEPRNRASLQRLAELHEQIIPQSRSEALELLPKTLALANHYSFYFPEDADAHRRAIAAQLSVARTLGGPAAVGYWDLANDAAERLMDLEDDPDAVADGTAIHGRWLAAQRPGIRLDADRTEDELEEGRAILEEALAEAPAHDGLRAAYLDAMRGAVAVLVASDASDRLVDEAIDALRVALEEAEAALASQPDDVAGLAIQTRTAIAEGWRRVATQADLAFREARAEGREAAVAEAVQRQQETFERFQRAVEALVPVAERWASSVAIVPGAGQPLEGGVSENEFLRLLGEASLPMQTLANVTGIAVGVGVADRVLERPEVASMARAFRIDQNARMAAARARVDQDVTAQRAAVEEMLAVSDRVLAMPPQPMGLDARLVETLRRRALAGAVEATLFAWELESDEQKRAELIASMEVRQQALEQEISETGGSPDEMPDALYGRGLVAFAKGDNTAAASAFQQVESAQTRLRDPFQRLVSLRLLGRTLEREGAAARAIATYRQLLQTSRGDLDTLVRLARLELNAGRAQEASALADQLERSGGSTTQVEALRRVIAIQTGEGTDDPVAEALARMEELEQEGRIDEALAVADELVSEPPASRIADVHVVIGDLAYRNDRRARAIAAFERAAELAPGNRGVAARLTMLNIDDPIQRAIELAASAIDDPAERAVRLANSFEANLRAIESRLAADPAEEVRATLEIERDLYAAALATQVEAARAAMGPGASARAVTDWMERLVREGAETGDWSDAEQFLADVRTDDLDRAGGALVEGQLMLARAAEADGDEQRAFYEQAVAALEEAETLLPFSAAVGRRLAFALQEVGRLDEAIRAYADAVINAPADAELALAYADALLRSGERALASEAAASALRRNPDDARLQEFRLALELQSGNDGVVLLERRRIRDREPANLTNALKYAYLLVNTMPTYATLVDDEGRAAVTPGEWARLGPAGQQARLQQERRSWLQEAGEVIADVADRAPDADPGAVLGLDVLRAMRAEALGDADEAIAILEAAVRRSDEQVRPAAISAAVGLMQQFRRVQDAYDLLMAEKERAGDEPAPMIDWIIASIFENAGRPDLAFQALSAARAAAGGQPFTVYVPRFTDLAVNEVEIAPIQLTRNLVRLILQAGSVADARRLWDESDPADTRQNRFVELSILAREADAARLAGDVAEADTIDARFQTTAEELTAEQPADPQIWGLRVQRALQRNENEGRVELLDQAQELLEDARLAVDDPSVLLPATLQVLSARGNLSELALRLEDVLEERPGDESIRRRLVSTFQSLGRLDDAERVLREGISLAGSSERSLAWRQTLGQILRQQDKHEEAAQVYDEAMRIAGEDNLVLLQQSLLARLDGESPRYGGMVELLGGRQADMSREPLLRAIYARSLMRLNRDVPAEAEFAQSLAEIRTGVAEGSVPISASAGWVAQVLEAREDDSMVAAEARVRRLADGQIDSWMLFELGRRWASEGEDPARAVELLEQAVSLVPEGDSGPDQRSLIRKVLGGVLIQLERPREALDIFEAALADTPRDADLLNNTAFLQATLLGDAEGALPRALAAVARQPDNWAYLDTAGKICSLLGRWDDAEAYLRRSIAAQEDARNTLHLAEVLAATDRRDEALRQLERASELRDPDDEELREEINQLADQLAGD